MALPPLRMIASPASAASGWLVVTMPCGAMTSERPCAVQPSARSPRTAEQAAAFGSLLQTDSSSRSCAHAAGGPASMPKAIKTALTSMRKFIWRDSWACSFLNGPGDVIRYYLELTGVGSIVFKCAPKRTALRCASQQNPDVPTRHVRCPGYRSDCCAPQGRGQCGSGLPHRLQPVRGEQGARLIGAHRLAEGKTLRVFAAELIKLDRIGIGFGAFRHHFHSEIVGEPDD